MLGRDVRDKLDEPHISAQFLKEKVISSLNGLFLVYFRAYGVVDRLSVRSVDLCMRDMRDNLTHFTFDWIASQKNT